MRPINNSKYKLNSEIILIFPPNPNAHVVWGRWMIQVERMEKGKGRPKITLIEIVKKDMPIKEVIENMTLDRIEKHLRLYVEDS